MNTAPAASRPTGQASRREPLAPGRRATQVVLVVGSVLALGAALGPLWLVRVGVVVALATTVVTSVLAWRELTAARRQHAARLLSTDRRHGDVLRTERTRNAEVVDALSERLRSTGMVVAGQRGTIAQLRGEVGVLTTERDALHDQVAERDGMLGLFRESLRAQEAALLAVREAEQAAAEEASRAEESAGAEVHSLPRRSRPAEQPAAVLDPQMVELAMVLPNYEGSRRAV